MTIVVRGGPLTPAELAALTAVLLSRRGPAVDDAPPVRPRATWDRAALSTSWASRPLPGWRPR
ncbi:acyl-CoA carboxylase subunit epsilon [Actinoplanes subglobosus]|uniref:Acyl-CoA carboxylase subunit epsilon n=1 Tax=Actinoplanes subglobosus TaxID=1547892 RepID=A0ABV8J4Z1_9ACTN